MKIYKPIYGMTAYYLLACFFLMSIPMSLGLGFILALEGNGSFWYAPIAFVFSVPGAGLLFAVPILLVNLVARAATTHQVLIEEDKIYYQRKHLLLDDIQYITLFLPEPRRYSGCDPQLLSLWINDKEKILIVRPSLFLIADLKKRCPKAKFCIEDPLGFLRPAFFVGLGITVVLFLIVLFSALG